MNPLESIPLQSRTLVRVAYDAQQSILQLEFHGGAIYQYFQVPASIYQELLTAESKGLYFNRSIRDQFLCHRIA